MGDVSITDAFRRAREAAAEGRTLLRAEEARLCSELTAHRKRLGMTQQQVSDIAGLSQSCISNIETGHSASVESLLAYAAVVGCQFVLKSGDQRG